MSNDTQPEIRFPGFTEAWEQRKLDDVVEFYSGLTYSPDNVQDDGTFVLRSSNVKNGEIIDADNVYVSHEVVNSGNVQEGDVIVVVRNGSRDLIGKHAQIKRQMDNTVIGAFMTGVRSETPDFTNAMLDTQQFAVEINKNLGATINQITTGAFKKMQFVVPKDRDEREAIGTFFRSIDDTITLHQRKLDLLKETKKGFLQKMFPKNGAKVPEIRFSGFTEDWEQRKLGDITESFSGGTPTAGKSEYYGGDIPFIRSGEISSELTELFITENGLNNSSAKMVKAGDILYALYGATSGEVSISRINGAINQAILAIRPTKNDNSYLIVQWLRKQKDTIISTYLQGGQGNLSGSIVKDLVITLPQDKEEQNKIGAFFKQLDDTIALHQRKLDLLKETKKGFLQKMFV
ncbi:restriction endonuclease subunit S [Enterococcus faecium]|nr:restriction endonuclease subunit S [Enterococcus faecium]EME3565097.1 restriction endonuclease subunit S [Enterococcus faecium]EME7134739.1 restriction endonuclease subunit S [Enterococcus faecium]MDU1571459.1 restriction endonuclease subunit S [Enterococcus hirae]